MLDGGQRVRRGAKRLTRLLRSPARHVQLRQSEEMLAAAGSGSAASGPAVMSGGIEDFPERSLLVQWRRPRKIYGELGPLEVRLAETKSDIRDAQRLRYQVFFEEMAASPSLTAKLRRLDQDPYDAICDHLLVTDRTAPAEHVAGWPSRRGHKVVGTYRLLRGEKAERGPGFYTQGEFDVEPLVARLPRATRFLELGRSCVLAPYRTKRTVELLWHGLWTYVRENRIDVMIGCASFEGTDPKAHAMALSLLHHQSLAPPEWRCRAHAGQYEPMNLIARDKLDMKAALRAMPPLIKGYMRLGVYGHFGAPEEMKCRVAAGN